MRIFFTLYNIKDHLHLTMITLDIRTLFITNVLISLYMSLVLFLYSRSQKTYPGFGFWLAGNVLALVLYFLYAMRGLIPDLLSIATANFIGILSSILRLEGMKKFFNIPGITKSNFLLPFLVFAANLYYLYVDNNILARDIIFTVVTCVLVLRMVWLLITRSEEDTRRLALFFAALLFIFIIGFAMRSLSWAIWADTRGPLLNTKINTLSILFLLFFDISWAIMLILLNGQRMNSEILKLTEQLEKLASIDPLTGVFNRRKFLELGEVELIRAKRYGRRLSLLMFDLNNFKDVNDTYGHAAGDEVLKKVVEVCKNNLRQEDLLGRFGGDEFVILFPETNLNESVEIARRLNSDVLGITYEWNWNIHVSLSYGVAQATAQDSSLDALIQRADVLLYGMKAEKQNLSPIDPV